MSTAITPTPRTYEEWDAKYKPIQNQVEAHAPFDGRMFETFGAELQAVRDVADPAKVWTLIESDGCLYLSAGFHFVNRLGYFITENPVVPEDADEDFIVDDSDKRAREQGFEDADQMERSHRGPTKTGLYFCSKCGGECEFNSDGLPRQMPGAALAE